MNTKFHTVITNVGQNVHSHNKEKGELSDLFVENYFKNEETYFFHTSIAG